MSNEPTAEPTTGQQAFSRRGILAASAVAGTAVVAGCGQTAAPSNSPLASGQPSAPTTGASSGGGQSGAGKTIVALSAVPVGGAVAAESADGKPIVVAQPTAGKAVAHSAICTHQGCTVAPAGKQLKCPCHGSVFDAMNGSVINGPAQSPLPAVPVQVSDGQVVSGS